jgi:hypothetical protein
MVSCVRCAILGNFATANFSVRYGGGAASKPVVGMPIPLSSGRIFY